MATLAQHKIQPQHPRSKRNESTLSGLAHPSSARPPAHAHGLAHGPQVVSTDGAWCCAASKPHYATHHRRAAHQPPPPPPPPPPPLLPSSPASSHQEVVQCESPSVEWPSPSYFSSPAMDACQSGAYPAAHPASYTKFKNALNAGLLNPMSPPSPLDKTRSSPTLFEMMANEQDYHPRIAALPPPPLPPGRAAAPISSQDRQVLLQERVEEILGGCSPGSRLGDPGTADVRLTLTSRDGLSVSVSVHRVVLVAHSGFFSSRLSDWWSRQQRSLPHLVEIADCDDIEAYAETLRLMYCRDLRRRLMREDVSKVLAILKVCAALAYDAGVLSCLEYLEAAPWAEDEEEKVAALLSQLQLQSSGAGEVLKRVSLEVAPSSVEETNENGNARNGEQVLIRLLHVVLEGKDEKARREMKGLVSKMLRENSNSSSTKGAGGGGSDLSKESLYSACDDCLRLLLQHFLRAATLDLSEAALIARQADNLHWILDILIDRQVAEKFLQTWAAQVELAEAHSRVPAVHRYEVSRVTARLFVGVGKGQILVSKEARLQLLRTWLEPFYEDFGWMRRACKGLDRHLIEDGLGNTILTLPLGLQQEILLAWFDRFLNSGDDCPNIQRGFEVWWRRAFWRRNGEPEQPPQLRMAAACENPC